MPKIPLNNSLFFPVIILALCGLFGYLHGKHDRKSSFNHNQQIQQVYPTSLTHKNQLG